MGYEFIVAIVAIACVTSLIETWINRDRQTGGVDEENFDRLGKAFIQHKKKMQERVRNLEAIIADEADEESFEQIETPKEDRTLTNDLQEKNKTRS